MGDVAIVIGGFAIVVGGLALSSVGVSAQFPGGPPGPPKAPKEAAPIDLTGYWVAVVNAVHVDPVAVAIGEPHKFDELGWFSLDALPAPLHSQLPETVALFREWSGA